MSSVMVLYLWDDVYWGLNSLFSTGHYVKALNVELRIDNPFPVLPMENEYILLVLLWPATLFLMSEKNFKTWGLITEKCPNNFSCLYLKFQRQEKMLILYRANFKYIAAPCAI